MRVTLSRTRAEKKIVAQKLHVKIVLLFTTFFADYTEIVASRIKILAPFDLIFLTFLCIERKNV